MSLFAMPRTKMQLAYKAWPQIGRPVIDRLPAIDRLPGIDRQTV